MNLKVGGRGGLSSKQQRENAKKSKIKQKLLRETDKNWVKNKSIKLTKSLKKQWENGDRKTKPPNWTGKKHKNETKKKISEIKKNTGLGKKNSQYNTYWITKNGINKKIKKNEIKKYEKLGWVRGRKIWTRGETGSTHLT